MTIEIGSGRVGALAGLARDDQLRGLARLAAWDKPRRLP
jgi:hypothetical protein